MFQNVRKVRIQHCENVFSNRITHYVCRRDQMWEITVVIVNRTNTF